MTTQFRQFLALGLALAATALALAAGCGRGEDAWIRIVPENAGALGAAAQRPNGDPSNCSVPFFIRVLGSGMSPKQFSFRANLGPGPIASASPGDGVAPSFQSPPFLIPRGPGRFFLLRGIMQDDCATGYSRPLIGVAGPINLQDSGDVPMTIRVPSTPLGLSTGTPPVSDSNTHFKYIDLNGGSPSCGSSDVCKVVSLRDLEADLELVNPYFQYSGSPSAIGNFNIGPLAPDTRYEVLLEHVASGPVTTLYRFQETTPPPGGPLSVGHGISAADIVP